MQPEREGHALLVQLEALLVVQEHRRQAPAAMRTCERESERVKRGWRRCETRGQRGRALRPCNSTESSRHEPERPACIAGPGSAGEARPELRDERVRGRAHMAEVVDRVVGHEVGVRWMRLKEGGSEGTRWSVRQRSWEEDASRLELHRCGVVAQRTEHGREMEEGAHGLGSWMIRFKAVGRAGEI